ncbi:uncharacterized protein LOC123557106 isoform X7 [Mercenaria mercenaria]|uniref:uncharacterized protein LOC123557106 isoform X7 n=1 Tax=Mercenaria mercenaria TaxID=6596 RepID=UPI00234F39AD|nr:uncharacterized protein LOC123557106 isoform X7 [Mercenaria mercenaria]
MYLYAIWSLFYISVSFLVSEGRVLQEDATCRREHGVCTQFMYENVRLLAQRSSGCKNFCQCAHASTQLDGSVTYMWVKHECPAGTLFDESLPARVCNHADQVQCNANVGDDCEGEHGMCNQSTYEHTRLLPLKSSGCVNFCQCEHASTQSDGSVTYKWAKQECPARTLFDERIKVCNHANLVQCTENVKEETTTKAIRTTKSSDANGDDNSETGCQQEHGVCNQNTYANIRLLPLRSSGCSNFCQCEHASTQSDGSVTYKWAKQLCPAGTLFDESIKVCNHANLVQCTGNDDGEADCLQEHGVCNQFTYERTRLLPLKRTGCVNFCQCEHASTQSDGSVTYKWAKQECPARTLFDESIKVCNHANLVQCTVNGNDDSDTECQQEYGVCTQNTYANIRLLPLRSSGCSNFCQCEHASTQSDGSVTYKWAKQVCPAGTLFDESIKVCNHANLVQCTENDDGDEDCLREHGVCNQFTYEHTRLLPLKSSGCVNFCQCEHASTQSDGSVTYRWAKQECPARTLFDERIKVCNHANLVQCAGSEEEKPRTTASSQGNEEENHRTTASAQFTEQEKTTTRAIRTTTSTQGILIEESTVVNTLSTEWVPNVEDAEPLFECYKCHKENYNSACNRETEVCKQNKQSCQTIVEWRGDEYEVRKGCKNPTANSANAKLGCKKTGSKIFCRFECTANLCNEPLPPVDLGK